MNLFSTQSHEQRTNLLIKNVFFSFFIKGWSAVVVLLMVPLTLECLGSYQNGVWLTISRLHLSFREAPYRIPAVVKDEELL